MELFEKAIKDTQLAGVLFTETMIAREDTIKVNGQQLDPENWNKAESVFKDAAEQLEDGDSDDAKSIGKEAEILYRKVELKAIQASYLNEVWSLLKKADYMDIESYAPITLEKAKAYAKKSASLLHLHRYDQKDAALLAEQAEYEINHAIYMAGIIKPLMENDNSFETIFLNAEVPVKQIGESLSLPVKFDQGFEKPVQDIIHSIHALQTENKELAQLLQNDKSQLSGIIKNKNDEIKKLNEKVAYLENRLNRLASSEEKLKFEIEQEKIRKEKIARISASFSANEGKALLDGKNVLIRLYGLNFPSGKSDIKPQFFGLLSKVKNAFSEFPGCMITIEGHTDSIGSDAVNQQLSEDRAEAVRQYIIANSTISWERIKAIGYGETRPVASNETPEGQAKNRRIDVVIQPVTP
jgi:outer membrane protein OmpA-like peptidoglycan-associated protein